MASLGPEDYGMPSRPFPLLTFLALVLLAVALFAGALRWAKEHPEEVAAAKAERVERCDPRARKLDKWDKPYCDPVLDAMLNGHW